MVWIVWILPLISSSFGLFNRFNRFECCIATYIYIYNCIYKYMRKQSQTQWGTSMNERTHFFIKIYHSHFILKRFDVSCVLEVSGDKNRLLFWPKVLATIAAFLSHLGWVAQPWVTEGPKPSVCRWLSIRHLVSNWLKPSVCWLYSAVLSLIYTGTSLDWWLGRGSICYTSPRNKQQIPWNGDKEILVNK